MRRVPLACIRCIRRPRPAGSFFDAVSSECELCPAGRAWVGDYDVGECAACAPGFYASGLGNVVCTACDQAAFQPFAGAVACMRCPDYTARYPSLWKSPGVALSECMCLMGDCPANHLCKWPAELLPLACTAVTLNTTGGLALSVACSDPTPGTGAYSNGNGGACQACPRGGICVGGQDLPIPAKDFNGISYPRDSEGLAYIPGSWRSRVKFHECEVIGACHQNFRCSDQFTRRMCTDERAGFFSIGGYTWRCGLGTGARFVSVFLILGVICIFFYINVGLQRYAILDIFFGNMRFLSIIAGINVDWPTRTAGLGAWFTLFNLSQFDVDLVKPTCLIKERWGHVETFTAQIVLVLAMITFYFVTGPAALLWQPSAARRSRLYKERPPPVCTSFGHRMVPTRAHAATAMQSLRGRTPPKRAAVVGEAPTASKRQQKRRNAFAEAFVQPTAWDDWASQSIGIVVMSYSSLTELCFKSFGCKNFSDGEKYLVADYGLTCGSRPHKYIVALAGLVFPVLVAFPFALALTVHRHRNKLTEPRTLARSATRSCMPEEARLRNDGTT
ncbi:hypothetical protein M885DRAFT_21904 [Pelagophyceae sp. CCMP2097]|nr:hypothetical protein M885DRAFT_21904 [Pelagophyceae sp. CCMP2097]